jgi:hypothetical protein
MIERGEVQASLFFSFKDYRLPMVRKGYKARADALQQQLQKTGL